MRPSELGYLDGVADRVVLIEDGRLVCEMSLGDILGFQMFNLLFDGELGFSLVLVFDFLHDIGLSCLTGAGSLREKRRSCRLFHYPSFRFPDTQE